MVVLTWLRDKGVFSALRRAVTLAVWIGALSAVNFALFEQMDFRTTTNAETMAVTMFVVSLPPAMLFELLAGGE